jgi:hypothetical protein
MKEGREHRRRRPTLALAPADSAADRLLRGSNDDSPCVSLFVVDRSTTVANPMDAVETDWTQQQAGGLARTPWTKTATLPR